MMPKPLNIEKLEKKFSSLTRSRESIQCLSAWIMHHKEYCQQIVDEWMNALMKGNYSKKIGGHDNIVTINKAKWLK